MAENSIIFRDNQETQADDFNNMQSWIGQSIDDVVGDAICGGNAYTGLTITKTAATQITVQVGRLYWAGAVYVLPAITVLDFYNNLPVTQNRQCAVVAWGTTVQQDIEPRNFIIDADTGQSQPQSVAMESSRVLNLAIVPGVENPNPSYPSISATTLLVGYVLLSPTGVVSFQQVTSTQLDNLTAIADAVMGLQSFVNQIAGSVSTLTTALAGLSAQMGNYTLKSDFVSLVTLVNQILAKVNQPAAYLWYGTDNFLDATQSQTTATVEGAYNATINEGLRFPGSGSGSASYATIQLLNPSDPLAAIGTDNFMLPTPSGARIRMDCSFTTLPWIADPLLNYAYYVQALRLLTRSRYRFACGPQYMPCPASQVWWYQAQLDPTTKILSFITETWETSEWADIVQHDTEDDPDWPQHQFLRNQYLWRDNVDLPYWSKINTNLNHSGNHLGQSFLNQQDGWLNGVMVYMNAQYYQPLTVSIVACDATGTPDPTQLIMEVDLTGSNIQSYMTTPMQVGDISGGGGPIYTTYQADTENTSMAQIPGFVPFGPMVTTLAGYTAAYNIPVYVYPLRIPIPPTFLSGGKQYAVIFTSTYGHVFNISSDPSCFAVHQGAYWYSTGAGLAQWTTGLKSLRFQLFYSVWNQWQGQSTSTPGGPCIINCQPLSKAGGIGSLEVLAEAIIPASTSLIYQIQVGGTWMDFTSAPNSPSFAAAPALLPFRICFNGTTDLMPGVSLTNSQISLFGATTGTLHHIGDLVTLGSPCSSVKIVCNVTGFVSAHQTLTASLYYGSTYDTTSTAADVINADGTLTRTWTFAVAITGTFEVLLDGTQDGTGDPYIVSQKITFAE